MIPLKRFLAVSLGLSALAFGAAGCGGGDSSTPPPVAETPPETVTLTKSDLISQGDAICAELNVAIASIEASTTTSASDKASQVTELYSGLADRLEKLGTPSDGPAPDQAITALRELADGSTGTVDPEAFRTAAAGYGFTDCAEGPSAPTGVTPDDQTTDPGYTAPAPAPEPAPAPAPAPAPDTGGVSPDTPPATGGTTPPSGGTGGSGGGSTGGIGPG